MKHAAGGAPAELLMLAAAEPTTKTEDGNKSRSTTKNRLQKWRAGHNKGLFFFHPLCLDYLRLLRALWIRLSAALRPRAARGGRLI